MTARRRTTIIDQIARDLGSAAGDDMALWEDNAMADHKIAKIKAAFEQIPGVELRITRHAPEEVAEPENPASASSPACRRWSCT